MSFNVTAVKVAKQKRERPEWYCPVKGCLWRTGGGYCPRHEAKDSFIDMVNQDIAQPRQLKPIDPESERIAELIRNGKAPGCSGRCTSF